MKKSLVVMTSLLVALTGTAQASDRYGQSRPPVIVSPDLTAPWLLQLGGAPGPVVYRAAPAPATRKAMRERDSVPRAGAGVAVGSALPDGQQVAAIRAERPQKQQMDPQFLPQTVAYDTKERPGTIVIDTNNRFLYLVTGEGQARRYGVGVGKPGFEWAGTHKVTRKAEWPDWRPPAEMRARERAKGHDLPVHMAGGPANPLGARAMYLGSTLYRIHGTNAPWTIGYAVSSGCIRMRNEDVVDLYERVDVGTKVIVI
ncbi:L,D-transpeptidase [Ensifer soli]|uniref:L,D-transpeptidase n=1 Tax=Ciceribacter sp. sgz301302 TaxID=3342379 RepID=UPI0035BA27A3